MRKIICFILIALFFQIIGCKDQFEDSTTTNPIAEKSVSSFSTEYLEWEEALQDTSFQNLIAEFGSLNSDVLILKGGLEKKKLKLQKSKVKKIKLGKNESFTIMIDSLDFSSLRFSNLLLTKNDDKKDAFIVKYYPERSWIASYIRGISTDFRGKVTYKKINTNEYELKSLDCFHVIIYAIIPCTGGPEHILDDHCDCGVTSDCKRSHLVILFEGEVCGGESLGGESILFNNDLNESGSSTPDIPEGGGYSTWIPDGVDSDDAIVTTTPLLPYDNSNMSSVTIAEDIFGIELGERAYIDIEDLVLFDPNSDIVIEGLNVAFDENGGFYFKDKGYVVYYIDGNCYVDVTGNGYWVEAGSGLNYFINYVSSVLKKPVTTALLAFAMMTPIDGMVTVITGENILGMEENQIIAGGFLLFEIIPGAKVLKPVRKLIPANALKFIAKKGDEIIELFNDAGIIKFASKSVGELAEKATKNASERKVMLGRFEYMDTPSYIDRATSADYKYLDIEDWNAVSNMVNHNEDAIFDINKQFIWDAHQKNNDFYFSHNPFDLDVVQGYFKREIDELERLGYTIDPMPIGENLWKATK